MSDVLNTAVELHEAGRLDQAAPLYQQIITGDPENAAALHLLGVLHHQRGDHQQAVKLISRAVAIRPGAAAFHANLSEAYRALGKLDQAVGCCRAALQLAPEFPEALNNLGLALQAQGKLDEAARQFRHAIRLQPRSAAAHNNLGIATRALGDLDEALAEFRAAVECDPQFAAARTNLGQILLDRGQPEEALPHCLEAVRLGENIAALHHNLGNAYRDLNRNVDARESYLQALRLDPKLTESQVQMGLILQREGRFAEAMPWLKQAAELDAANPTAWQRLARLHEQRDDSVEAAAAWTKVVELSPDAPASRVALGWAMQEQGLLTEAADHYRAALSINPHWPAAHLNLGGIHEELGEMAQAASCFRAALRGNSDFALPHARLATLLRGKLPDDDLTALRERLTDADLPDQPRSHLLFALAHVLDARGEYPQAAELLRQANALAQQHAAGEFRTYVPADHEKFVDGLIAAFDKDFFARTAGGGSSTERPVFVFGLPRSGTTLIEQILASHSEIEGAGELRFGRQSFEAIPARLGRATPPMECIADLNGKTLGQLADAHLEKLSALSKRPSRRIVDKMPDNYLYAGLLAAMFPKAAFIHARRDLRDVAFSCWMTDFRSITWASDMANIASRFTQYRRIMEHWRSVLPLQMHEVEYESSVADLEPVARGLINAAGLEWESACLEFHRTIRPIRTASVVQVRQPIYKTSAGRWKHYEMACADMFARLPSG
jgi:tetratricopeptide (TPR) repeat protein